MVTGTVVSLLSAGAVGCGPGEGHCDAVAVEPQCGETIEPTIVDRVGVPKAHAIARDGAKWMIDRGFGDYVSGVFGVYTGSARVTIEGEWGESFELVDEVGVVTWSSGTAGASFESRDESGRFSVDLQQAAADAEVGVAFSSTSNRGSCAGSGVDLAHSEERLATTLTCQRSDPPATAEVVLDYERIAPEEVSVDEALRAATVSLAWPRWDDRLVPCGSGRVYDTEVTFTDASENEGGTTTWHVDTRTTWYVAERCPQTAGATRIEILRVESCFCPTDGHCHGRADEDCVCLGDVAEDDPICAW